MIISACNGSAGSTIALGHTPIAILDWDGDGRTDVLYASGTSIFVQLSTGQGVSAGVSTGLSFNSAAAYVGTDFDGDGLDDLASWTLTSVGFNLHNGAGQRPDLLSNVTDGYGISSSPSYVSITRGNYTKGTGAVYPEQDVSSPQYVVSQVTASDGIGGHVYANLFLHRCAAAHRGIWIRGLSETHRYRRSRDRTGAHNLVPPDISVHRNGVARRHLPAQRYYARISHGIYEQ